MRLQKKFPAIMWRRFFPVMYSGCFIICLLSPYHHRPPVFYCVIYVCADNHTVREAACACIGEFGSKILLDNLTASKIDTISIRDGASPGAEVDDGQGLVDMMLRALLNAMRDARWPVRDAACIASGACTTCISFY